jgi:hypothetical protein
MSSGGPTTVQALEALRDLLVGRGIQDIHTITSIPGDITAYERQTALEPLFVGFRPHLGLRLLASLARDRSLRVLTTNWDDGFEQACELLGIRYVSFSLQTMESEDWERCGAPAGEAAIVHLHGTVSNAVYSRPGTVTFTEDESRRLGELFLAHTTVFLGASLSGDDSDISRLLRGAWSTPTAESGRRPVWYFGRRRPGDGDGAPAQALAGRDSSRNVLVDPDADFDEIAIAVLEGVTGQAWGTDVPRAVALPPAGDLILPAPRLVREALDRRVVVIVGEPEVGKTTLACLIAHVDALCWGAGLVQIADGGVESIAAVGAQAELGGAVVLEDPFGTAAYESAQTLVQGLVDLSASDNASGHPRSRFIVTTRRGPWVEAQRATPEAERLPVVDAPTEDWYRREDLIRIHPPSRDAIIQRGSSLTTPRRVGDFARGRTVTGRPREDHLLALRGDLECAALACLVRLQDYIDDPHPAEDILGLVLSEAPAATGDLEERSRWAVSRYRLDGLDFLRLRGPSHAEAVDVLLGEVLGETQGPAELHQRLLNALARQPWDEAVASFALLSSITRGTQLAASSVPPNQTAAAFARSENPSLVTTERLGALDRWELIELARELVRLWPTIRHDPGAHELLERVLTDETRHGTYALAETVLYFGSTTDQEIAAAVNQASWRLLDPRAPRLDEAVRFFDGLLWRPEHNALASPEWIRRLFELVGPDLPEWGALLAACAQHPSSTGVLRGAGISSPTQQRLTLTAAHANEAAGMVLWHFAHQARNRATTVRHAIVDMPALRRRRQGQLNADDAGATNLIQAMARYPETSGCGLLLGVTLACTDGIQVDDDILAAIARDCEEVDDAIILAAVTFELPSETKSAIRRLMGSESWKRRALAIMASGVDLDGQRLSPPRFRFARSTQEVRDELRLNDRGLRMLGDLQLDAAPARMRAVAADAASAAGLEIEWVLKVIAAVDDGDLDVLASARRDGEPLRGLTDVLADAATLLKHSAPIQDTLL